MSQAQRLPKPARVGGLSPRSLLPVGYGAQGEIQGADGALCPGKENEMCQMHNLLYRKKIGHMVAA